MNSFAPRRRASRLDARPAILWFALTTLLLSALCVGALLVRAVSGEWLELKMDSARVRVLQMLPKPSAPDHVPTPLGVLTNDARPTIVWRTPRAARAFTATPAPTVTSEPTYNASVENTPTLTAPTSAPAQALGSPTPLAFTPAPTKHAALQPLQTAVQLGGVTHEAQRFNNCGPTTLRMYFSFFAYRQDTQVQIANVLKPNKDDRNVSPVELMNYARQKGFHAQTRVNGDVEKIKALLSNGLPVMIEEGYDPERAHQGWMGHYLLLTGYDENGITAQDSYNGPNQVVSWQALDEHWRHFNRTYLVVYTDAYVDAVQAIIGEDLDDATMYAKAAQRAQDEWNVNPDDAFAAFNLGSSLVGLGEYEAAAQAFDQARRLKLPWRMLWYQFGPYEAYLQVGRYDELVALADATLRPTGDLEESYYYKGRALAKLGRSADARAAFELALHYNAHYDAARQALDAM
ncbi:MAG: hypothetical protein HDKAJFGB_01714 [Anaerolineae bacterium]|nr:hypothetical protein [Anaerolineae bacterium]